MSQRMVQHAQLAHFRVGMVSATFRQPDDGPQAPATGRGRRGQRQLARGAESDANLPATVRGPKQEMRLVASRLAYFDLPSFTALPLVTTDLTETADPMLYFSDLDENGYYSACKRLAAAGPPFFEARQGGVPDIVGHSSCLDELQSADDAASTAVLVDCTTGYTWTYPPTRSPTPRSKLTKRLCGRTLRKWNGAENGYPHPSKSARSCPAGTVAR